MVSHRSDPIARRGQGQAASPRSRAEALGPEPQERVARALARAGVASRREVERMIEEGRVALNGQVLTSPAVNVGPRDILTVDGQAVSEPEATRVFRYHKPVGLLTTHNDPKGRPTVFASLPREIGRVISVGRLDLNSEGLLLLTNDGALARQLELPDTAWVRRYRARAYGRASQAKLDSLKDGVSIDGVSYGPVRAVLEKDAGGSNHWIMVAISEGRNREVRKLLEHIGLKVNRLIRLSYGPFELGDLIPGEVEELAPKLVREHLKALIAPQNLPQGAGRGKRFRPPAPVRGAPKPGADKGERAGGRPQAPGGGPRASAAAKAAEKPAYKPGWARPKRKPKPAPKPPGARKRR